MFPPLPLEPARTYSRAMQTPPAISGKTLGILVCHDADGNEIVLKAFSGQLRGQWIAEGFVPPPLNTERYSAVVLQNDAQIHHLSGQIMSAESEHRLLLAKNKALLAGQPKTATRTNPAVAAQRKVLSLKAERRALSRQSLAAIYALFRIHCIDGSTKTFRDIFGDALPPTGTGECCAPKLLDHAFARGLRPVSLYEWQACTGEYVAPCEQKCRPLLIAMLGLEIVYRDEHIIVVNKQSGVLSVPGRGADKQDCIAGRVRRLFPQCMEQPSVHRLDMDTSGLMVLAFDAESHRALSMQFMEGTVQKEYVALLRGAMSDIRPDLFRAGKGHIELRFRLDIERRPHQVHDEAHGKLGITDWELVRQETRNGAPATRVLFRPRTGRTHQLRLHCAFLRGLNMPIIGDNLYGAQLPGERLLLHASRLRFSHPVTGDTMDFSSEVPF